MAVEPCMGYMAGRRSQHGILRMPSGIAAEDREFIKRLALSPEESLQLLVAATENGIFHWDIIADELTISRRLLDMFEIGETYTRKRGEFLEGIVHPEDLPRLQQKMKNHLEAREPYEVHARFRHRNGRYIWASSQGQAAWDDAGNPYRFLGIVRNLDELEQARRAQQRSEHLARIGHFRYDILADCLDWSDGAFRIHGYEPASFSPDRHFARSRYLAEDREEVVRIVEEAIANKTEFEFRARIIRDDNEVRQLVVHAEIERGADGEALAYFGTVQDITEEMQREEEIRQIQKQEALGKLVAGVAHDFNNILAVALGNAELLKEASSDEERDQSIGEIIKAVDRGASLSSQLLAFGRRSSLAPAEYDVGSILHDIRAMLSRVLPEKINVMTSGTPDAPKVFVDRHQLETALLNLAINARDAMPEGGRLDIDADSVAFTEDERGTLPDGLQPGTYTRIRVTDTGIGVSKEMQQEIFDPFFTTKPVGKGSGLGLSMVLGFAKQSGGTVHFASERDKGTTVSLFLPTATAPSEATESPDQASQPSAGMSVLVVEDEAPVRQVIARQLESGGHDVAMAANGQEAAAMLRDGLRPDILVTDLTMPGSVQGFGLAKIAKDLLPELRIIFVSGFPREAEEEIGEWGTPTIILRKPVRRDDLLSAIQNSMS